MFAEVVHLYLARDLEPCPPRPEHAEVFTITWLPFEEALRRALHGGIDDGKSVAALVRAAALRQRRI